MKNVRKVKVSELFITSWEELSTRKFIALLPYLHAINKRMVPESVSLLSILEKKRRTLEKMTSLQIVDIFRDVVSFLRKPLLEFKLKSFRIGFTYYYAPSIRMSTSSFAEFMMMDTNLSRYMITSKDEYLLKIISSLYRPKSKKSKKERKDIRDDFKDYYYNQFEKFKNLSEGKKMCILKTAIDIRVKLMDDFPNLFPRTEEQEEQEFTPSNIKDSGPMWSNIRFDVAGTPQIPGIENVDTTNMYTILSLLEKMQIDNKKREEELNRLGGANR